MATTDGALDTQILDIMLRAGSRWVLWLLITLSLAAVAVMLERAWFYLQERRPDGPLADAIDTLRKHGPAIALGRIVGLRSMEAAVARACLERASAGIAAVEEHRTSIVEYERQRYERRLAFLGTLGNNAPFIGLFGTVLGIIHAFHDLAGGTMQNTQAVMSGIAEALVATAVGLVVALPAVATYNAFTRHVESATSNADAISHEILSVLKTVDIPKEG
jgi:biopolymer transport protein ExbB/TolQ